MENKLFDQISAVFNTPMPEGDTMDQYLDQIIPMIRKDSEDLREEQFYTNKPWVEVQDNENFHELVFHFFSPIPVDVDLERPYEREYLITKDGKVERGKWRFVGNKIFIGDEDYEDTKVYELAFMDNEFMILKLLANPKKFTAQKIDKYFVLAVEKLARKMEWLDLVRYLFEKYQNNNLVYYVIAAFIAVIVIMLLS